MPEKKVTKRLHILHSSQRGDKTSGPDTRNNFNKLLDREPDVLTCTEVISKDDHRIFREVMRNRGYAVVDWPGSSIGALRVGKENQLWMKQKGSQLAHAPKRAGLAAGYVNWVKMRWNGLDIWIHSGHWPSRAYENREIFQRMTRMMGQKVREHGKGEDISFFTGDMNADPDDWWYPGKILREYNLKTIYEDAGKQPPTLHRSRSVDVIGRYIPDRRVELGSMVVHPPIMSDHRPVSAWYKILVDKKHDGDKDKPDKQPGKPDKPKGITLDHTRSFKDYSDRQIYELPYAVDKEDDFNG